MSARIDFDPVEHRYRLNGQPVPGVTSILEPLQKLDDIPADILAAAGEFGRHVHEAVHLYNLDNLAFDQLDPRLALYVDGYRQFLRDSKMQVLLSEFRVASPKFGYCGTLDLYGILNKRKALIDVKSTAALPRSVGLQTAAYEQALRETTGDTVNRRYCLHLKPGGYKLVELTGRQDLTFFISALNIHRWHGLA